MRQTVNGSLSTGNAAAETAIAALGFLAGDESRLERFLALSGLGPNNLRSAAANPGFLAAILDYLLADEPLLIAFASERGVDPAAVARARDALAGSASAPDL